MSPSRYSRDTIEHAEADDIHIELRSARLTHLILNKGEAP